MEVFPVQVKNSFLSAFLAWDLLMSSDRAVSYRAECDISNNSSEKQLIQASKSEKV